MTDTERAALKAELMREIMEELREEKTRTGSAKTLQPALDKWCNGHRGGNAVRYGPMIEALPKFKGWQVWECVRRITCSIMNVSYVRDIRDADRACRIADRLCDLITEMAKEE